MSKGFFSREQKVALWFAFLSFVTGLLLVGVHEWYQESGLSFLPTAPSEGLTAWVLLNTVDDVGVSLIVASLLAIFYELALRSRTTDEIVQAVRAANAPRFVRKAYLHRYELDERASDDIQSARKGDRIDLIGTSQRVLFSDRPGHRVIADRVAAGVTFRILLLHPESALVACIEGISNQFGFPDLYLSLEDTVSGRIAKLRDILNATDRLAGTIEIRLHRDVYSTLSYHRSPKMAALGLYFAHESGTQCPVLLLEEGEMTSAAAAHFERLWELSSEDVLISMDQQRTIDNLARYFPGRQARLAPNAVPSEQE